MRSGLVEGIDIALHHRNPIEPKDTTDWLLIDLQPMAQSIIEVGGKRKLLEACKEVIIEATKIMYISNTVKYNQSHDDHKKVAYFIRSIKAIIPLKCDPEIERAIQQAITKLGEKLNQFTCITRINIGVNTGAIFYEHLMGY